MTDYNLSEGAKAILTFLAEQDPDSLFTFRDIADAIGKQPRSVSATITSLAKKGLLVREEIADVKVIRLTDAGSVVAKQLGGSIAN